MRFRSRVAFPLLVALLALSAVVLAVPKQGRISGKVTDGKGDPLEGVKITITTAANSKFRAELTTGKDGTYATFLNDTTVSYHYVFEKPGYATVEKDKKVPIWNPNDYQEPAGRRSGTFSVLDVRLLEVPHP